MKAFLFSAACFCSTSFLSAQALPAYSVTVSSPQSTGYYFMTPIKIGPGSNTVIPKQMIVDRDGLPVYLKTTPAASSNDFKIQPNGLMSYAATNKFYIMDSTFTIKDSVALANGLLFDGHDLQILPNGHFLLLGMENVTMDLSGYNLFNGSNPGSANAIVRCNVVQEQDANKNVVFEWHCRNHYSFTDVDPLWLTNPNNVDWTHANAVAQDADGNILLSLRHFNEITKISRSDSSIIWRLGGSANQFTFTNDAGMFRAQHDIRRIANGHITLLDNGLAGPPLHAATAKEYDLNETTHSATLVWSYCENPNTYSGAIGNVQRLPSGNTLVNYGQHMNMSSMFKVVTPAGNKVFEMTFANDLRSYRVFNYAELPWDFQRPVITCYMMSGQSVLDAGDGYASYLWSDGATSRTIAVNAPGNYQVAVPHARGGYVYSEPHLVTDPGSGCASVGIRALKQENLYVIYPNPFAGALTIKGVESGRAEIFLTNVIGQQLPFQMVTSGEEIIIDPGHLASGLYFLSINGHVSRLIKE